MAGEPVAASVRRSGRLMPLIVGLAVLVVLVGGSVMWLTHGAGDSSAVPARSTGHDAGSAGGAASSLPMPSGGRRALQFRAVLLQESLAAMAAPAPTTQAAGPLRDSGSGAAQVVAAMPRAASAGSHVNAAGSPSTRPTDASDPAWVDAEIRTAFGALQACTAEVVANHVSATVAMIACDEMARYVLGPAELTGTDVAEARAVPMPGQQVGDAPMWEVDLTLTPDGVKVFADVTMRLAALEAPRNMFAIVVGGRVVSNPTVMEPMTGGRMQISGNFTQADAEALARSLGANGP